jgi:NADH dehydrogenase
LILVTGATGLIGRHLVARLVAAEQPVRVLLPKHGSRPLRAEWANSVDIVSGTLDSSEALHTALIDVHTVIHLASAQWWGRRRDLNRIDLQGTQNLITAARAARIGRLIVLSHLGASPAAAFPLLRVKGQMEEAVRNSGLAYTIIRSGVVFGPEDRFVNGIAATLRANPFFFLQPGQGENLLHPIYIDDLVEALYLTLEAVNTVDQVLEFGGPEYVTFNEMLRTVMRVSKARRTVIGIPPYILKTLTINMRRLFPRYPMTPQWYDYMANNRTAPLGALFDTLGIRPRRFEDTLVTYMPKRRYGREFVTALLRRRVGHE